MPSRNKGIFTQVMVFISWDRWDSIHLNAGGRSALKCRRTFRQRLVDWKGKTCSKYNIRDELLGSSTYWQPANTVAMIGDANDRSFL